jgi:isoleucyl-tRNA synthetase
MKLVNQEIQGWGKEEIAIIEREGKFPATIGGEQIDILLEETLISSQDIPGWSVATERGLTVALDVTVSELLKQEGIARDLVNRIQNLRKDMGLEVMDKIHITIARQSEEVDTAIKVFAGYIQTETQALELTFENELPEGTLLDMDEFELTVRIEKK